MHKEDQPKRHFFLKIFSFSILAAYLVSWAAWYISPMNWWPLGLASIAFAYLWLLLPVLGGWWWVKKQRVLAVVCAAMFLGGLQPGLVTFSIGSNKDYNAKKGDSSLRVMQWNCRELPGNHIGWKKNKEERKAIENFMMRYQPDVLCMEDFAEHIGRKLESNYAFLRDTLGYPYHIFAESSYMIHVFGKSIVGTAIFSKRPFIRSGIVPYSNKDLEEYIVWADVLLNGRFVRIVATHFKSMNLFSYKTYKNKNLPYYLQPDSNAIRNPNIFFKIKYYQAEHAAQAMELKNFIDTCSIPVVLGSDMNTVPASATYRTARGHLQDGFIGSKTGMGNTYNYLLPNLRIDYLLHGGALEAKQWKHFTNGFFDHDHLMADFSWKEQ